MSETIYQANCSGIEAGQRSEMGFRVIFSGTSEDHAIQQAAKFLGNRCRAFDLKPGCIKVCHFTIREIGEDGMLQTMAGFDFFEWKWDTSTYSLEDLIGSMDARGARR